MASAALRIIFINKEENTGYVKHLSEGVNISKGKYIARMDADDVSSPNRLIKQVEFFNKHPQYVVVGTWCNMISAEGNFLYLVKTPVKSLELKNGLPNICPFFHSSVMMKKEVVRKVGGYKDVGPFFYQEDMLLWIDLSKEGEFYNIPEVLHNFRITPSSSQQRSKNYFKYQQEVVNKYFYKNILDVQKINAIDYSWGEITHRKKMTDYHMTLSGIYIFENFNRLLALKHLIWSLVYYPLNHIALFYLLLAILPQSIIQKWQTRNQNL